MSLGIVVKGTEGVVLAADSRVSVGARRRLPNGSEQQFNVDFDNTNKLIHFSSDAHQHVGVITYGQALIGQRTPFSYKPEIELQLPDERVSIERYSEILYEFYQEAWENQQMPPSDEWEGPPITFIVSGYDPDSAYGRTYQFSIPGDNPPAEQQQEEFGMSWGGETQIVTRLIKGFAPGIIGHLRAQEGLDSEELETVLEEASQNVSYSIPYEVLPLQDCVNLAILMIRTTIDLQGLAIGPRGVGGKIEVATITRTEGVNFIQKKQLRGESALGGDYNDD